MMKLGFSTLACPAWDLETIAAQATEYDYAGVELCRLEGEPDLTRAPALTLDPPKVRRRFADAGLELVCLGTEASFTSPSAMERAGHEEQVRRHIELAARLDCPCVRVFSGTVPPGANRHPVQARVAEHLRSLAPFAAEHRVTILVENSGDFARSKDLWFFADAVEHPAVQCCWNVVHGMTTGEKSTISIPRMGGQLGLVHLSDATFDEQHRLTGYVAPGSGQVEFERLVQLLRGIAYTGYLMFDWPQALLAGPGEPDQVLSQFANLMHDLLNVEPEVLTAYKGDKHPAKFASRAG